MPTATAIDSWPLPLDKYARIFGAVFSVTGKSFNQTGPVQFGWAHSLHPVETRYTQGTVVMPSKDSKEGATASASPDEDKGKTQGTIWTQYQLPFAVFAMPGIVNATIAGQSGMGDADVELLLAGLWKGTLHRQARGRGLQQPLMLLHVEYVDPFFRIGFLEEGLKLDTEPDEAGRKGRGAGWQGGNPPTDLADVSLNVNGLAEQLNRYRDQIARARVWVDSRSSSCQGRSPPPSPAPGRRGFEWTVSLSSSCAVRWRTTAGPTPSARTPAIRSSPAPPGAELIAAVRRACGSPARTTTRCRPRLVAAFRLQWRPGSFTVTQQLSLHGKKWIGGGPGNDSFHRPTTIELIVEPHYRVYYKGPAGRRSCPAGFVRKQSRLPHLSRQRVLPDVSRVGPSVQGRLEPIPPAVERITLRPLSLPQRSPGSTKRLQRQYARVGGLLREHIGGRRFRGTSEGVAEVSRLATDPVRTMAS